MQEHDLARWGRLGIATRERMLQPDKFGDIDIPRHMPRTAAVAMRPAPPEKTGFTRGALVHGAQALTGGFVYVEPPAPPAPAPASASLVPEVSGRTMPSGFAINNNVLEAPGGPPVDEAHYAVLSIGYPGAAAKVSKYGEMLDRPPTAIDIARATMNPEKTLKVEDSGFTRTNMHERRGYPSLDKPPAERDLHPTQVALRKMADPVEYWDPHEHKQR